MLHRRCRLSLFVAVLAAVSVSAADPTPEQVDHFEKKVRPLLVENCNRCHSEATKKGPKGGLRTDGRSFLLKGGDSGPAVVPGDPVKGKLIEAVRYKNVDLLMPPKGKLSDEAIRDLERWIKDGAPWPDDKAAVETKSDFDLAKRKAEHWAWQPLPYPRPVQGQRSMRSCGQVGRAEVDARRPRGQTHPPPPGHVRAHRAAADPRGHRRV